MASYENQQHIPSQDYYKQVILNLHHKNESTPQYEPETLLELIIFFNNCLYHFSSIGLL